MDLNESLAFVTVVREGTFTAAGQRLKVPTSTVSRQVKRLEERLGVRLLHRTTRSMTLTEVGDAYFEYCSRGIDVVQRAEAIAHEVADTPRGVLRVSVANGFHRFWEAFRLSEFLDEYPEVRIEMREEQRAVDLIAEGYDVAIRGGALPDSSLMVRKLAPSSLRFYAAPSYLAEHGEPRSLDDLVDHPFFGFPIPSKVRHRVVGPEGEETWEPPESRVTVNSWPILMTLVRQGRGIGSIEHGFARRDVESGAVVRVLPDYEVGPGGLYAVYPSSRLLSPKVRVFLDHVADRADRMTE